MKQYIVFSWKGHDEGGGWNDFIADFDNKDDAVLCAMEAINKAEKWDCIYAQIIDINTGKEIEF